MYEKVKAVTHAKYYHTNCREAEMIKTASNIMLVSRMGSCQYDIICMKK